MEQISFTCLSMALRLACRLLEDERRGVVRGGTGVDEYALVFVEMVFSYADVFVLDEYRVHRYLKLIRRLQTEGLSL